MSQNDGMPIKKIVRYNSPNGKFFIRIGTQQQHDDFYQKWESDITNMYDNLPVDQVYNMMTSVSDEDIEFSELYDGAAALLPEKAKIDVDKIIDFKADDIVKIESDKKQ